MKIDKMTITGGNQQFMNTAEEKALFLEPLDTVVAAWSHGLLVFLKAYKEDENKEAREMYLRLRKQGYAAQIGGATPSINLF